MRWLVLLCSMFPALAAAQEPLPPPELDPAIEPAPPPAPAPEPDLRLRVRAGQLEDGLFEDEEADEDPLPRNVPAEMTNEVASVDAARAPEAEPAPGRRWAPFAVAAGVSWARLLSAMAYDFVSIHQRFEARVPGFEALRLGAGISELISDSRWMIIGGARIGLGAVLFDLGWLAGEAIVSAQLGVAGGDLGVYFDLRGTLDVRFLLASVIEIGATGGIDFLGETTMIEVGGLFAIPFG
jgi:hypothetical protein